MQEHLDTKRILAAALKQLTCRKSFDKITIADITQQSGYNRQTFYYHFRDINTIRSDETCFEQFLFDLTKSIFHMAIVSLDQHHQINEVEMNFYSQFYSFGITGVIISWVKSDMRESAERVSANLKSLAQDSEKLAYSRYREAYTKITNEEEEHEE